MRATRLRPNGLLLRDRRRRRGRCRCRGGWRRGAAAGGSGGGGGQPHVDRIVGAPQNRVDAPEDAVHEAIVLVDQNVGNDDRGGGC